MSLINNKKLILIIFAAIIILAGFGFAGEALAGYYATGTLVSTNLLDGVGTVSSINSFWYNASSLSGDAGLKVQFSNNDKVTWKNSSGTVNGWDACSQGEHSIDLSGLSWSGPNFYYKMEFTSSGGANTPVLDEIKVTYTSNTAPTVSDVLFNSGGDVTLTPDDTTSVSATANISDDQGCNTISTVEAKIYRSGATDGKDCSVDKNDCYSVASCTETSCVDTDAVYTCTINMEYYADPTDAGAHSAENWRAWVEATDDGSLTDDAYSPAGTTPDVITQLAFDLSTESINYGEMSLGTNTGATNETVNIINTGNVQMDVQFDGTNMSCSPGSIPVGNEKYGMSDVTYTSLDWPLTIDTSPTRDWNVEQRTEDTGKTQTEDKKYSYWGIEIPATGVGGSCSGTATFTAVNDQQ